MRRIIFTLLAACLSAAGVFAQPSRSGVSGAGAPQIAFAQNEPEAGLCRAETKYDRDADTTTIECALFESYKDHLRLIVHASVSFQGKEPNETAKFWLVLSSYKGDATRRTSPLFKDMAALTLSVNAAQLELPIHDYRKDFYEMNRMLAEQARAELSREDLRELLDAESLAGKGGSAEFRFSGAALAALKEFITRKFFTIDPAGQGANQSMLRRRLFRP